MYTCSLTMCFCSSSRMFAICGSLNSSVASTLVLVYMGMNLVLHPQLSKGLALRYSFLDYVQGQRDDKDPRIEGVWERDNAKQENTKLPAKSPNLILCFH